MTREGHPQFHPDPDPAAGGGPDIPVQIGPYTITREIGRGGMGVVYLARDTKLDRDVAIKALPPELADDPERMARFEREAKTLASLNHPHIASIYGLEEVEGQRYLILEYVPGDTLDEALNNGPLPVSEALPIAKQIAEAMESAHEHGIIHRDLKPANIKFATAESVKVLDFGLAKGFETESSMTGDAATSPTYIQANTPTNTGVVLGTAGYLSPEQARGRAVDKRSDIFSFGCVLFEMLAGKTVFAGETVADSLGATLHKDPNWDELPADTPPTILLLLRRCLTKDRKRRLHDIADARVEIEDAISDPTSSSLNLATAALAAASAPSASQSRARIAIGLVVGALLTAAALILPDLMSPDAPPPVTRLSLNVPHPANAFGYRLAVSLNGRTTIISGDDETGQAQLFLRQLERTELTPLPDLVDQGDFTCSPDGQWIAYRTRSEGIRRAAVDGGPPSTLCEVDFGLGIFWSPDGWIYFSDFEEHRILRVRENGGEPEVVAASEIVEGPQAANLFLSPLELPGGAALLCVYAADMSSVENYEIRAYSLVDDTMKTIVENAGHPHYTSTGHLVFLRDATLMAAPFDAKKLELTGPAVSLVEGIAMSQVFPIGVYGMSGDGTLYYASDETAMEMEHIVALDLEGEQSPLVSFTTEEFGGLRSSPDGSRLAMSVASFRGAFESDIWLVDVARDIPSLLTTEAGWQANPLWSPDAQWVYYVRRSIGDEEVTEGVYRRRSDFGGEPELVLETEQSIELSCFDPDGTRIFIVDTTDRINEDLLVINLEDEATIEPWLATPADESEIAISPNGRWAAYLSNETGRRELYIRSITGEQKQRISTDGASRQPMWSPDGAMLYYQDTANRVYKLQAVTVTSGHEIVVDGAEPSDTPFEWEPAGMILDLGSNNDNVSMHPDGKRFIMISSGDADAETPDSYEIHVIQNFFEILKQRASTKF